jgi:hypothetical protein
MSIDKSRGGDFEESMLISVGELLTSTLNQILLGSRVAEERETQCFTTL